MQKTHSPREAGNLYIWMFVIAFGIGLLVAFFVAFSNATEKRAAADAEVKIYRIKNDFSNIRLAILMYREDHQKYPSALEDLTKSDTEFGPYLDRMPLDPFTERPYRWEIVDGKPCVVSYGADGQPGGTGVDADIRSSD